MAVVADMMPAGILLLSVLLCWGGILPPLLVAEGVEQGSNTAGEINHRKAAELHVARAVDCYRRGNLDCAIAELTKARNLRPGDAQIRFMLGNAWYRKKHWHDAILEYRAAARLRPNHPDTYLSLGFAYYQVERTEDAVAAWTLGVKRSPVDAMARMALAVGLFSVQRTAEAARHLSRALHIRPDSCQVEQLSLDIRWRGSVLNQVQRLCQLRQEQ